MTLDFTAELREKAWIYLSRQLEDYYAHTIDWKVTPVLDRETVKAYIDQQDLSRGIGYEEAIEHVMEGFRKFHVHTPHPHYLGLFNPRTTFPSIMGDTIAATINPQMASWSHAPFGVEIENRIIRDLGQKFGLGNNSDGTFTSGGAEANLTAMCCALNKRFPEVKTHGVRSIAGLPKVYCSLESHHSIMKAAAITGLGTDAVVPIEVNERLEMRMEILRHKIEEDINHGDIPFMIVGTAGTTGAGAFDDLREIRKIADHHHLWMHTDAAYGGASILTEYKGLLDGIEGSDSITFDAHKWLSVPMGAGIFFTRDQEILNQVFNMATNYMPKDAMGMGVTDPYNHSIQWSRRSTAMKLYMSLLMIGWEGYGRSIEGDFQASNYMKQKLEESGWKVYNQTDLPILCFNRPDRIDDQDWIFTFVQKLIENGETWLSVYPVREILCARACITNYNTRKGEIDTIVSLINRELEKYESSST